MLRLMVPAAIGAGAAQINLLVGTLLASLLGTGAISHLYYAERITWLPIGIIGVAVATALLPRMSRLLGTGEEATAVDNHRCRQGRSQYPDQELRRRVRWPGSAH